MILNKKILSTSLSQYSPPKMPQNFQRIPCSSCTRPMHRGGTIERTKLTGYLQSQWPRQSLCSHAQIYCQLYHTSCDKAVEPFHSGRNFPHAWKTAAVVPIPKSSTDKNSPANYRPISLYSPFLARHWNAMFTASLQTIVKTQIFCHNPNGDSILNAQQSLFLSVLLMTG